MRVTCRCDPRLRGLLPPPVPARSSLPGWLREMPQRAHSAVHDAGLRTVKHCPPFVDAMTYGFILPLPCDVMVASGRLSWHWELPPLGPSLHPRSPISFHSPAQVAGTPLHPPGQIPGQVPGQVIVKFNSFWTIEVPAGWSLFATHPVNRPDLPFRLLSGLVDADRFHDVGILFPAVWTDFEFAGVLARGTPVAQCFPVPREALELATETFSADAAAAYDATGTALLSGPGVYRKRYRAPRA